jgi:hypothetical protein
MATPIKPSQLANVLDVERADFCEACRNGEADYAGYPIGDWLVHDGHGSVHLNVPDELLRKQGVRPSSVETPSSSSGLAARRDNPAGTMKQQANQQLGQANMADAVRDSGPHMTANAAAGYAVGEMSGAVRENPEIMEVMCDVGVILGSGGIGLAATDEGDPSRYLKVLATMGGGYGVYKLLRHLASQDDRRTDMAERQQRHEIQQDKQQRQVPPPRENTAARRTGILNVGGTARRQPRR